MTINTYAILPPPPPPATSPVYETLPYIETGAGDPGFVPPSTPSSLKWWIVGGVVAVGALWFSRRG